MIVTNYAIKLRVTVFALIAILAVAGPLTYFTMPREGVPDITIPLVFVTAPYESVAPAEIENLVTIPLEKRFNNLANIKKLTSSSAEGMAVIVIEFTPRQNIDDAIQKVKDKVDQAKRDLPDDLDQPTVEGLNFSTDIPVLTLAVSGDPDLERLKNVAEDLQDLVETAPGVLQARLYGAREREIRADVDLPRLTGYGLTLTDLEFALRRENSTVSAGNLETGRAKFQVRVPGEFTDVRQLESVILRAPDGRAVRLSDVAAVTDAHKDVSSISRVNGEPCVTLAVHKRAGENADTLIRGIKKMLARAPLPPGIRITIVNDHSEFIRMMIEDLENNIVSGFLMVLAILLLFLGLRNSIFVALAIPFSMMIGFVTLASAGLTLNMIVLFSLVLCVGMLVDNAIVIVENIYRHHAEGESRIEAARNGASEVAWPVINSTLTTLAAFLPLMYWPGIMGQFMSFLPKTVIIVLSASLFVAMVMNPALCSVFINRPRKGASPDDPGRWGRFMNLYERFLRGALDHRAVVMLVGVAFLVFTVVAFGRFTRGVELFPETEPRRATISVRYPEGTDIRVTDATLRRIEEKIRDNRDIKFYLTNVGSIGEFSLMAAAGAHLGSIVMEFVPLADRREKSSEIVKRIRAGIGDFPGAEVKVEQEREGPPTGAPVGIEVSGEDFDVLSSLADEILAKIRDVPGLVDLQEDLEDARPELQFLVDRDRAAQLGLDTDGVGQFLRAAVTGQEAGKFRSGEDEYDITVRVRGDQRQDANLLKQAYLTSRAGGRVPLASLGTFSYEGGRGQILRKDQKRMITISGTNQGRGVDRILEDVRARLATMTLPKGYAIAYAGDTQEMNEASAFLSKAFLVALALIALILIMEFNSVVLPFLVLMSVILSMAGVMWSLLASNSRFCVIMTGIAVVSLAGVVVNNGIVLIDCIVQRKKQGFSSEDAIVIGGRLRLRPVLLTAITTVVGLVPMAAGWSLDIHAWPWRIVGNSETAAFWAPMAVAVMYGLALATLLTLVQVPVMFSLTDSLRSRFREKDDETRG